VEVLRVLDRQFMQAEGVPYPNLDAAQRSTRATLSRSDPAHPATNDKAGLTIAAEIGYRQENA
jgi:hypothetical protein